MKIELEKEIINKSINSFYFQVDHLVKIFNKIGFRVLDLKGIDYPIEKINLTRIEHYILLTL